MSLVEDGSAGKSSPKSIVSAIILMISLKFSHVFLGNMMIPTNSGVRILRQMHLGK